MKTADLDRQITIQRVTTVPNELNEPVETWADFVTVRARKADLPDTLKSEMLEAGQIGSYLMAHFTVRSSAETRTVSPVDRVIYDGVAWNISNVKETADGRNRFIEITAARDAD